MRIDASRPTPLSPADVREWAAGRTFFISSAMADTRDERLAVADAIDQCGGTPIWFERFGARGDDAQRAYLTEVDRSDHLVAIYRARYGTTVAEGRSATHAEYLRAKARNKPIDAWVLTPAPADREAALAGLITEVRLSRTTGAYRDPADLAAQVSGRIADLAAEDVSPWVKLGDLVFRAASVTIRTGEGRIEARLRPGPVLEGLARLTEREALQLTVRDQSIPIRVTGLTQTVESATRTAIAIDYRAGDPPNPTRMAFSNGTVSLDADEILALRLRTQLFGEATPGSFFYFWCDFIIETAPLRDRTQPDSSIIALTRLFIVEALIGGGYVGAIRAIEVGPAAAEGRRVRVRWQDRKVYTNVEPAEREVEGIIRP